MLTDLNILTGTIHSAETKIIASAFKRIASEITVVAITKSNLLRNSL